MVPNLAHFFWHTSNCPKQGWIFNLETRALSLFLCAISWQYRVKIETINYPIKSPWLMSLLWCGVVRLYGCWCLANKSVCHGLVFLLLSTSHRWHNWWQFIYFQQNKMRKSMVLKKTLNTSSSRWCPLWRQFLLLVWSCWISLVTSAVEWEWRTMSTTRIRKLAWQTFCSDDSTTGFP